MKQAFDDLLKRLLEGTEIEPRQLVVAVLVIGLVFSAVHLLTMLVTRWGDHRASLKALVLSLLIHVMCGLGVITSSSANTNFRVPEPEDEVPEVEIRELLESTAAEHTESGDSPIWDQLAHPREAEPERAEVNPRDLPPIDDPTRTEVDPIPEPIEVADASLRPDELRPDAPNPFDMAATAPRRIEPEQPSLEDPTVEQRAEVDANPGPRRNDPSRPGGIDEEAVHREVLDGGVRVPRPEFDSADERMALLERNRPDPTIQRGPISELIRNRTGPQPSPRELEPGIPSIDEDPEAVAGPGGVPTPRRLARRDDRATGDEDGIDFGGPPERVRTANRVGVGRPERLSIDDAIARHRPSGVTGEMIPSRIEPPSFGPAGPRKLVPVAPELRRLDPEERREIARKFGGSDESEEAVERALAWLAKVQHPDGYWDADEFEAGKVKFETAPNGERVDRDYAGKDADAGITGLALLAFFAAGHTPFDGPYANTVRSAIDWLSDQQTKEGYLGARARYYAQTYSHAIASFALAEALGIHRDYGAAADETAELEETVRLAVDYIIERQNPVDGGWRYREYVQGQKSDTSIFGWQMMALNSADRAGVRTPSKTRALMVKFLLDRSLGPKKGLAAYRPGEQVSPAMTAEALFCKQQFGIRKDHPSSIEAVEYLQKHLPSRESYNLYYWYYGTLAMYHQGGEPWEQWNDAFRDLVISEQVTAGEMTGSWPPRDKWAQYGGRVYSTAMATLCLESYYRFYKKQDDLAE